LHHAARKLRALIFSKHLRPNSTPLTASRTNSPWPIKGAGTAGEDAALVVMIVADADVAKPAASTSSAAPTRVGGDLDFNNSQIPRFAGQRAASP